MSRCNVTTKEGPELNPEGHLELGTGKFVTLKRNFKKLPIGSEVNKERAVPVLPIAKSSSIIQL